MGYNVEGMYKYIDTSSELFSQLEFMGGDITIPEPHKSPMLLASIDTNSDLGPIYAALRTKESKELTGDYVSTTLTDEYNERESDVTRHGK